MTKAGDTVRILSAEEALRAGWIQDRESGELRYPYLDFLRFPYTVEGQDVLLHTYSHAGQWYVYLDTGDRVLVPLEAIVRGGS